MNELRRQNDIFLASLAVLNETDSAVVAAVEGVR